MFKKFLIISIISILVIAVGFFLYKAGFLSGYYSPTQSPPVPEWQSLLVFKIENSQLTQDQISFYQENFNSAKADLEKNPDDFDTWLYIGLLKKGVNDYEGARDVWLYAAKIRPKSSTPFANLADLYANFLNEPLLAEQAIKTAIENDPKDYSLYITLAEIYRYKIPGKEALYEATMLDAINKFPDNPNLIGPLALYYRQTNQIQKAITYYEQLVRLSPENQAAKDDLAELKKQE